MCACRVWGYASCRRRSGIGSATCCRCSEPPLVTESHPRPPRPTPGGGGLWKFAQQSCRLSATGVRRAGMFARAHSGDIPKRAYDRCAHRQRANITTTEVYRVVAVGGGASFSGHRHPQCVAECGGNIPPRVIRPQPARCTAVTPREKASAVGRRQQRDAGVVRRGAGSPPVCRWCRRSSQANFKRRRLTAPPGMPARLTAQIPKVRTVAPYACEKAYHEVRLLPAAHATRWLAGSIGPGGQVGRWLVDGGQAHVGRLFSARPRKVC